MGRKNRRAQPRYNHDEQVSEFLRKLLRDVRKIQTQQETEEDRAIEYEAEWIATLEIS